MSGKIGRTCTDVSWLGRHPPASEGQCAPPRATSAQLPLEAQLWLSRGKPGGESTCLRSPWGGVHTLGLGLAHPSIVSSPNAAFADADKGSL